jgi:MFS family permease
MLFSSSAVIITRYIAPDWWGRAFGINGLFASVGFAMGSPLGGFIQEAAGWSWIFFVNVPVGLGGLILARHLLRKPYPRRTGISYDWAGFLLSLLMLSSLTYALHSLSEPSSHPLLLVSAMVAVISLILFVRTERRARDPLLNLGVFRNWRLDLALLASFIYMIILAGTSLLFPFYLLDAIGYQPSTAGLFLSIPPAISILLAYHSGKIADTLGPRIPCTIGMVFCSIAALAFLGFGPETQGTYILVSFLIFGIGIGLFVPASVPFIMNESTEKNRGEISSLKSLTYQTGKIIGIAFFTLLFAAGLSGGQADPGYLTRMTGNFTHAMALVLFCTLLCLIVCLLARPDQKPGETA